MCHVWCVESCPWHYKKYVQKKKWVRHRPAVKSPRLWIVVSASVMVMVLGGDWHSSQVIVVELWPKSVSSTPHRHNSCQHDAFPIQEPGVIQRIVHQSALTQCLKSSLESPWKTREVHFSLENNLTVPIFNTSILVFTFQVLFLWSWCKCHRFSYYDLWQMASHLLLVLSIWFAQLFNFTYSTNIGGFFLSCDSSRFELSPLVGQWHRQLDVFWVLGPLLCLFSTDNW